MEDLPPRSDLPPLPSSRNSSRAPSRQSSSPDLTESHIYIRDFVRETRQRLNFTSVQLPILDDNQLSELSDGETILIPLSCSALNALASMTRQLDIITTQLGTIQAAVHSMPTWTALQDTLNPINVALRDLSHRVSAAPPSLAPAPARPPIPPTGATTRQGPAPAQPPVPQSGAPALPPPRTKTRAPPRTRPPPPRSIRTYPGMIRIHAPFTATLEHTRSNFPTLGKRTHSAKGSTPTPPLS